MVLSYDLSQCIMVFMSIYVFLSLCQFTYFRLYVNLRIFVYILMSIYVFSSIYMVYIYMVYILYINMSIYVFSSLCQFTYFRLCVVLCIFCWTALSAAKTRQEAHKKPRQGSASVFVVRSFTLYINILLIVYGILLK